MSAGRNEHEDPVGSAGGGSKPVRVVEVDFRTLDAELRWPGVRLPRPNEGANALA